MKVWNRALLIFATALAPVMFCCFGGSSMLYMACAVFLHECAHLAALWICRGRIRSFRPAPFGLCIEYDESTLSLGGEIAVAAAGCLVNFLTAAAVLLFYHLFALDFLEFGIVSALVGGMNLFPMHPLDGARLLQLILSAKFGPDAACRTAQAVTYCFGFILFLVAAYLLLTGQAGIYPLLFSVYIFAGNAQRVSESRFL